MSAQPPSADAARPLQIWAVSDGRVGIEAQALGLAEAVARQRPSEIAVKRVAWRPGFKGLPLTPFPHLALTSDTPIAPPWPDLWIAAGRASLPFSRRIRRWSRGRTFVAQTQDPRGRFSDFDLVIPPIHDEVHGDNVFPIVGAPNRMSAEGFARDLAKFEARLAPLPHPRIAMIVGGRSKTHDLTPERARQMAEDVKAAVQAVDGGLLLSFTRRTPPGARAVLSAALQDLPSWIWDGEGDNPYFAFLAAADTILVTEDSTNLATDAATTGKPIHVLAMDGGGAKFDRFHDDLRRRGVARRFMGTFDDWRYPPLAETDRAAKEILHRMVVRATA